MVGTLYHPRVGTLSYFCCLALLPLYHPDAVATAFRLTTAMSCLYQSGALCQQRKILLQKQLDLAGLHYVIVRNRSWSECS